jgi:hypothetical protein
MAGTNNSSGEKKIVNILAIVAPVRYWIYAFAMPLITAGTLTEYAVRRMKVNRPATIRDGVVVRSLLDNVLLRQDIFSFEPPTFPFTWYGTDPFQCQVRGLRK